MGTSISIWTVEGRGLPKLFRQICSYLPEEFRQIRSYLPEQFRQILSYLPEQFRQIHSYLLEQFRQIRSYLPEVFQQITSSLFYLNMSDQTNAAIVKVDTKDRTKLFSLNLFLLEHICLSYILYTTIPYIVQLGKTLAFIVTND